MPFVGRRRRGEEGLRRPPWSWRGRYSDKSVLSNTAPACFARNPSPLVEVQGRPSARRSKASSPRVPNVTLDPRNTHNPVWIKPRRPLASNRAMPGPWLGVIARDATAGEGKARDGKAFHHPSRREYSLPCPRSDFSQANWKNPEPSQMELCVAVNGELRKSNAKNPGSSSEATKNWPALVHSRTCFHPLRVFSVSRSLAGRSEGVVMSLCAGDSCGTQWH